jgi:hypothetical protein
MPVEPPSSGRGWPVSVERDGADAGDVEGDRGAVAPPDPRQGLPADERALLEAFDRLRPQGTLRWNFDDAVRRLSEPDDVRGRAAPWTGLPTDLWARGRGTKATERVMGDVMRIVAQDLTEYTDRAVDESRGLSDVELAGLRQATLDAVRLLSARVDRLESDRDPLDLQTGELDLPAPNTSEWHGAAAEWVSGHAGAPVVVGELGDGGLVQALADSGVHVDAVDPRGSVFWEGLSTFEEFGDAVTVSLAEVLDHLRALPASSRSAAILAGCVDRVGLADKVTLVGEAARVVVPGGTLTILMTDQGAWDAGLDPVRRDLLAGRPLHPEAWRIVLGHRGMADSRWHPAASGTVHAVVTEVAR